MIEQNITIVQDGILAYTCALFVGDKKVWEGECADAFVEMQEHVGISFFATDLDYWENWDGDGYPTSLADLKSQEERYRRCVWLDAANCWHDPSDGVYYTEDWHVLDEGEVKEMMACEGR